MPIASFFLPLLLVLISPLVHSACDLNEYTRLRDKMVQDQIVARGIQDPGVIRAMKTVPRHCFVSLNYRAFAYGDYPLSIGNGQTISQPYIVAYMSEALELAPSDKVLEIGTGSGYQTAILAELAKEVYTIEIIADLGKHAQEQLRELGYKNIQARIGDGYKGWPEAAPFDAIIVTCAPEEIPKILLDQLKDGGRMVIPLGNQESGQQLFKITKKDGKVIRHPEMNVRFVPMVKGNP